MERAIEFLLDHHAKVSADIERHSEQIARHSEQIARHSEQISQLTQDVQAMRVEFRGAFVEFRGAFVEIRDAINNLIIANEVTRNLAEQTAQLTIQNSQRIAKLEEKAS